jgi:hypothetical protein
MMRRMKKANKLNHDREDRIGEKEGRRRFNDDGYVPLSNKEYILAHAA